MGKSNKPETLLYLLLLGVFQYTKIIPLKIGEVLHSLFKRQSKVLYHDDVFVMPGLGVGFRMLTNENGYIQDIEILYDIELDDSVESTKFITVSRD